MTAYDIIGPLVLGFIFSNEQSDVILDDGALETDGHTVWYITPKGERYESITNTNVIEVGLAEGLLRPQ